MPTLRVLLLLVLSGFTVSTALAAPEPPTRTVVIPAGWDGAYDHWHYAPAIRVGDTVIVSGIPADNGRTYEERIHNLFEDLKKTLAAAGATMDDVVEIDTYHSQVKDTATFEAEFKRFTSVYDDYFPHGYPAWTAVGTTALLSTDAPVEMRAVAIVGSGKRVFVSRAAPANQP